MATLRYEGGTLALTGVPSDDPRIPPNLTWDGRAARFRAPALDYADIVLALRRASVEFEDAARAYTELAAVVRLHREPRPFQAEAVQSWQAARSRGVVVLPTGAGKTHVAVMAIEAKRRSALIVAPTLDLVRQWYDLLQATFGQPVGVIGGGDYAVHALTVTTYDSAYLHMDRLGSQFGLVIFDECHHLPSPTYALAAKFSLAPFRLGLTATPERADGSEAELNSLIGPIVYRLNIKDLAGQWLSEYETIRIEVELSPDERLEHDEERALYRAFLGKHGIRMSSPRGFSDFIVRAAKNPEGRRAMRAFLRQREISMKATAKLAYLEHLLDVHREDRALIFTQDNATAYFVSRRYLLPVITHQTKVTERSEILGGLAEGRYHAVVTSKVLNEGVDVREANVAVVLSGSGSVREHVQRLGRILRKSQDKRAVLYELVTAQTIETFTSERRREHDAYR